MDSHGIAYSLPSTNKSVSKANVSNVYQNMKTLNHKWCKWTINADNHFLRLTMKQRVMLIGGLLRENYKRTFKFHHLMNYYLHIDDTTTFMFFIPPYSRQGQCKNLINKTLLIAAGNLRLLKLILFI